MNGFCDDRNWPFRAFLDSDVRARRTLVVGNERSALAYVRYSKPESFRSASVLRAFADGATAPSLALWVRCCALAHRSQILGGLEYRASVRWIWLTPAPPSS